MRVFWLCCRGLSALRPQRPSNRARARLPNRGRGQSGTKAVARFLASVCAAGVLTPAPVVPSWRPPLAFLLLALALALGSSWLGSPHAPLAEATTEHPRHTHTTSLRTYHAVQPLRVRLALDDPAARVRWTFFV
jgi:hypothetical protein